MRGICKEEDYAFLGHLDKSQNQSKDTKHVEDEWRGNHEDRVSDTVTRRRTYVALPCSMKPKSKINNPPSTGETERRAGEERAGEAETDKGNEEGMPVTFMWTLVV